MAEMGRWKRMGGGEGVTMTIMGGGFFGPKCNDCREGEMMVHGWRWGLGFDPADGETFHRCFNVQYVKCIDLLQDTNSHQKL